jgi:hypothetical protein
LFGQQAQHLLAARQHLAALPDFIALQVGFCRTQLVGEQLQPQLRGLVLDDEEHLVVVRRVGQRLLRGQQLIQAQIAAVGEPALQVGVDTCFELTLVFFYGHRPCHLRGAQSVTQADAGTGTGSVELEMDLDL